MAGLAEKKTRGGGGGQAQPSNSSSGTTGNNSQQQIQRSLSRRVSFNESTIKQSPKSVTESVVSSVVTDIESQKNPPPKKRSSRFNLCCAWASLVVGVLTILILVLGGVSFLFFQSNLPDFRFESLNVTSFEIVRAPNSDTLLSADIEVTLNATNKNDKIPVFYSSLTADLSSDGVSLGSMQLPDLLQRPQNFTDLKIHSVLNNVTVSEDAQDLQTKSEKHQLLIDLVIRGNVHFDLQGQRLAGFPFKVICQDVYQGLLDDGKTPKCIVKLTPVS
ncbi:OLC1v1006466C1 [Oldenlandia corymbosa var. corymbosa]|uniref:OLC1v1006466C1 n=1 Tax=Oldenlandia corymbosa var. corymbosa TaxID=529605 RepID=A0AAV1DHM0_OLDCO|nr:OLC1v1006466C1 [Oldenlandia corymbosa var. corymbosa]